MAVDPIVWITSVTALANMVAAVATSLRSSTELERVRQVADRSTDNEIYSLSTSTVHSAQEMVIDEDLLRGFVEDIEMARRRFTQAINEPGFTLADIKREEQQAELVICEHMKQVRKYNKGQLPGLELKRIADSFRCFAAESTT